MTACAALYTNRGVILACDSLTTDLGMRRAVRKMWGQPASDGWRFTACGDADVILSLAAGTFEPGPDPRAAMFELRDAVRSEAAKIGRVRTGDQGTSFVHVDIIAAHPVHGLWLIQDGQCVDRWTPEDGLLAIGDPTAVRAAFMAAGGGPDVDDVLDALRIVGSVSAVVGGPYRAVEALDGHWGPEVVR
jgi:hypothetical protein